MHWIIIFVALTQCAIIFGCLALIGARLSKKYQVASTIMIDAPRERIHELIADLEQWDHWEPWREKDPKIVITRGNQTSGVDACQSWTDKSGGGELVITRSNPGYGVDYDLLLAGKYECQASITHAPTGDGPVRVTWLMSGSADIPVLGGYLAKLMPRMIRPMFDRGLQKLKQAAESE
ncbi:MAG: SRPBCC family protein [Phycisphaeraceae bacterium]|nr:SRPBCC family protein [Phycisphaeraceae bacterium]